MRFSCGKCSHIIMMENFTKEIQGHHKTIEILGPNVFPYKKRMYTPHKYLEKTMAYRGLKLNKSFVMLFYL